MEKTLYCIYRHIKPNGEVFYIGRGKKKSNINTKNLKITYPRAYDKKNRKYHWLNIVEKYECEVQILAFDLTKDEANELEVILIKYYGRKDLKEGNLVNLTDGGDGGSNPSPERRKIASESIMGDKHPNFGKNWSEETKKKMSISRLGKNNPMYGKPRSKETKDKISECTSKQLICKSTFTVYSSIRECVKLFNIKEDGLIDMLKGRRRNLTSLCYLNDFINQNIPEFVQKYNDRFKIYDKELKKIFNSPTEASKFYNLSLTSIIDSAKGRIKSRSNLVYLKDYINE